MIPHLRFVELQVKMPEDFGQNQPRLCICELSADTVSSANTEWLRNFPTIAGEFLIAKPPLREELVGTVEIPNGTSRSVLLHCNGRLPSC